MASEFKADNKKAARGRLKLRMVVKRLCDRSVAGNARQAVAAELLSLSFRERDDRAEWSRFGVAFVVGVGGEIILKLTPGMPVLAPAIFAILVLCAYALYAYLATELRMDAETIEDNCYYLGFLFTLTALGVTLFFIVEGGGSGDAIPEIISGFGVALSSTIAGVFLRVLMMQFKVDVESRERRERLELNEASRRFRTELSMSIDQIKTFSVESVQRNVEREAHMQKAFDQSSRTCSRSF